MVDLSVHIENNEHTDHPGGSPRVTYRTHKETAGGLAHFFQGLREDQLPDGEGWAVETVTLSTHNGTHMDAPWHFHSTTDHGRTRAPAIDETPLEYCFKPGVKLDFRHLPDGHVVSAGEVEAELERIGHELQPLDIVLVNTSAGAVFGQPGYVDKGCGMGREATLYLTERGVRVVGTDGWSWDAPSTTPRSAGKRPATLPSSGKVTKRAARSPTGRWRSCTTSRRCRPAGSPLCAFR